MEGTDNLTFDIGGLLTEEEAAKFLEKENQETKPSAAQGTVAAEEIDNDNNPAERVEDKPSESVGLEVKDTEPAGEAIKPKGDGSSPTVYSSIANALKNDGLFPDVFTDEEIAAIKTADDFAEAFEKAFEAKMSESQRRIDKALRNGVEPDVLKNYEQTLAKLSSITQESIAAEGEEGESLRSMLIYNDLLTRGYSEEKAARELEKSMKSGSDIEDAKDALAALMNFYSASYQNVLKEAEDKAAAVKAQQKKDSETFRKMILEDEFKLGSNSIDKRTRQQVYDAVTRPVYKDPQTGQLLTEVQKFQRENPMEFAKQIGLWYVLTSGGKNLDGLVKEQVRVEKNKGIRELERKINTSALDSDGALKLMSGSQMTDDTLLSDGWTVNMGNNN